MSILSLTIRDTNNVVIVLSQAEAKGVLHCDIHASNIWFYYDDKGNPRVVLGDWDSAKRQENIDEAKDFVPECSVSQRRATAAHYAQCWFCRLPGSSCPSTVWMVAVLGKLTS